MDVDYLSDLPVDLFFQQITYLPYDSVVALCSTNKKFRDLCSGYENRWKALIFNTFSNIPDFSERLKGIQKRLFNGEDRYNYQVYAQLQANLDVVTLGMIYYKQGDMKSFHELPKQIQFLALFLLNKRDIIVSYLPDDSIYEDFLNIMYGTQTLYSFTLASLAGEFAKYGNLRGIKLTESKGIPLANLNIALRNASASGHLEIVRYLIEEKGTDIHSLNDVALRWASEKGQLEIVKYLVGKGANVHARDDEALRLARKGGYSDVVRYLKSLQ